MKALILNSGMGRRMGDLTENAPKCMTVIEDGETILSRQLKMMSCLGITEVVMTTGYQKEILEEYCHSLELPLHYVFVNNQDYEKTNYIYSIYCAREMLAGEDILLLHGDLVFGFDVLKQVVEAEESCMVVSSTADIPQKDFKAVIKENQILKVGIEFFDDVMSAQPFYMLKSTEWNIWLRKICEFCENGDTNCYAENALNAVTDQCRIQPLDIKQMFCTEVDTLQDLENVRNIVKDLKQKSVYLSFSTDILHSGHMALIKKCSMLGKVVVGVLTDKAVAEYKRFPMVPFSERKVLFENIKGIDKVIEQKSLSYKENIRKYCPDYVVHGDDWKSNFQKAVRQEVIETLSEYGGTLIEFPYEKDKRYEEIDKRMRLEAAMPDIRRGRLKKLISLKGQITALEAHSGITGLIAENTVVYQEGKAKQFDAMWVSSLCDSTAKGKPDIELVDMSSRFRTIDDILEVTTKPIIFDGDTGGLTEHFVYTVRTLERMGVSMIIIEDKTGLKKNSLFGTEVSQTQDSIENFCSKIAAGKRAKKTQDFMIVARIESLILERGMQDAMERALRYVEAGADGIMIHSRKNEPDEVFEFIERFRTMDQDTPLVVVPTSFNSVTEEEFKKRGVNVVIYANHLTRSGFPAMQNTARRILECHRAKEASEEYCMPIKEIINLIPEE